MIPDLYASAGSGPRYRFRAIDLIAIPFALVVCAVLAGPVYLLSRRRP